MFRKAITPKLAIVLLFSLFSNLVSFPGFCDLVYLKSGENIEGIIEKENEASITLNVGSGRIILKRNEIKNIRHYTKKEQNALKDRWSLKYFMYPDYIPEGFKGIIDDFKNLENERKIAIESKIKSDNNKKSIKESETESAQLKNKLNEVHTKISAMKPEENIKEYNSLIEESNLMLSRVQVLEYDKEALEKGFIFLNKQISGYVNDLALFRKTFMEKHNTLSKEFKEKNKFFFEGLKNSLEEMEKDFTQYEIDYNRYGSTILVEAVLNGLVKANFIVDTGASVVVISRELADKLKLGLEADGSTFQVTLADGSKVSARPVILEHLKVGEAEVENVQAAIIEKRGVSDEDGLLGMSFLKNFLVRINTKENKLILEKFNP